MKPYDDDLLLFHENLKSSLYELIYAETQKDFDFWKWDIEGRVNHIFSYKKKKLKDYFLIQNRKEVKKWIF